MIRGEKKRRRSQRDWRSRGKTFFNLPSHTGGEGRECTRFSLSSLPFPATSIASKRWEKKEKNPPCSPPLSCPLWGGGRKICFSLLTSPRDSEREGGKYKPLSMPFAFCSTTVWTTTKKKGGRGHRPSPSLRLGWKGGGYEGGGPLTGPISTLGMEVGKGRSVFFSQRRRSKGKKRGKRDRSLLSRSKKKTGLPSISTLLDLPSVSAPIGKKGRSQKKTSFFSLAFPFLCHA